MPKVLRVAVVVVLLCSVVIPSESGWTKSVYGNAQKNPTDDTSQVEIIQGDNYDSYLRKHENAARPDKKIVIEGGSYAYSEGMEPEN